MSREHLSITNTEEFKDENFETFLDFLIFKYDIPVEWQEFAVKYHNEYLKYLDQRIEALQDEAAEKNWELKEDK